MADAKLTGISRKETLQYLGWLGSPIPDELEDEISRCESRILETARPRAVWRLFDLLPDGSLAGTQFRPEGQDVPALLKDCSQVILMAVTLGSETERLLRTAQARSMGEAVMGCGRKRLRQSVPRPGSAVFSALSDRPLQPRLRRLSVFPAARFF